MHTARDGVMEHTIHALMRMHCPTCTLLSACSVVHTRVVTLHSSLTTSVCVCVCAPGGKPGGWLIRPGTLFVLSSVRNSVLSSRYHVQTALCVLNVETRVQATAQLLSACSVLIMKHSAALVHCMVIITPKLESRSYSLHHTVKGARMGCIA